MKVMKIESEKGRSVPSETRMTEDQLCNELNYYRAEKLTEILLKPGLITADQYAGIMAENRHSFKPILADLF